MVASSLIAFVGDGFNLSQYSLRGATADLQPIDQSAQLFRDVNGNSVDNSLEAFRKYRIRVSCNDQESPGFAALSTAGGAIWPGTRVQITLPPQLGSPDPLTFNCMVSAPWTESFDEYAHQNTWSLELEQD